MVTHDLSALEALFSEEEIWGVVRTQELDKAPWLLWQILCLLLEHHQA
jgi:hypothetical protein